MKLRFLAIATLATLSLTACLQQAEDTATTTPSTTPTDGSQSASQLAADSQICAQLGSVGTTYANKYYRRALKINANNTYTYDVSFNQDTTACAIPTTPNGSQQIFVYSQSGTFTLNGIATSPSDATKITFTPLAQSLTVRSGYDGGALAGWLNGCNSAPTWSTSGSSTQSVNGNACTPTGGYALGDFPVNGAAIYNVIKKSTTLQTGSRINLYNPGAFTSGSVGTTYAETYTVF